MEELVNADKIIRPAYKSVAENVFISQLIKDRARAGRGKLS